MGYTIAQKIIKNHLLSGEMTVGSEVGLKIDQTLTQDATGTMAYLEFEAIGVPRVKTEKSVGQALRTPTTTDLFSRSAKSTVFIFHVPETVFAIRFTLSALASPARH